MGNTMFNSFVICALTASLAAATGISAMEFKFINFVAKYGKSYATREEYTSRMALFE